MDRFVSQQQQYKIAKKIKLNHAPISAISVSKFLGIPEHL